MGFQLNTRTKETFIEYQQETSEGEQVIIDLYT